MELISNKLGIVYVATNLINNKQYVGQTSRNLKERKDNHRLEKTNFPIHLAIEKYGFKNFKWIPIEYPIEELDEMECFWIKKLNTIRPDGYNLQYGGQKHRKHNEETKIKISERMSGENHPLYGKPRTEETKQKQRNAMMGRTPSNKGIPCKEETKKKISRSNSGENNFWFGKKRPEQSEIMCGENNPMYGTHRCNEQNPMWGHIHSNETKQKQKEKAIGRKHTKETKQKMRESRIRYLEQKKEERCDY